VHSYNRTYEPCAHRISIAFSLILALATAGFAQSNPPAWSASTTYKAGDIVSYLGNSFQCQINETSANHPNPHTPSWEAYFIYSGACTVAVGPSEVFKTLGSAWNYIKNARFAAGSSMTISLDSNYAETLSTSFSLNHPFGSQIHIVGNHKGQTVTFKVGGFVLDNGNSFAELSGFKIALASPAFGTAGITVGDRANLSKLTSVDIAGFHTGLLVDGGKALAVEYLSITGFGNAAVEATNTGAIRVLTGFTVDCSVTKYSSADSLFIGFYATKGGSIDCPSCQDNNCSVGFKASDNGTIYADESSASSSTSSIVGYWAINHSTILAYAAASQGCTYGFWAQYDSFINVEEGTASGYVAFGYEVSYGSKIAAVANNGGTTDADSTSYILLQDAVPIKK
jgi:hypothetical protein